MRKNSVFLLLGIIVGVFLLSSTLAAFQPASGKQNTSSKPVTQTSLDKKIAELEKLNHQLDISMADVEQRQQRLKALENQIESL